MSTLSGLEFWEAWVLYSCIFLGGTGAIIALAYGLAYAERRYGGVMSWGIFASIIIAVSAVLAKMVTS